MQRREMLSSYEDAYTAELKAFHECVVNGMPIKTTAEDAASDLKLYEMMYDKMWPKQ